LGCYTDDGKLDYAGRVGTGMPAKALADLRRRPDPLAAGRRPERPTAELNALRIALLLSRVHWVEPKLIADITYLNWTKSAARVPVIVR
jgi:ATP-dependent DNA ligase